MLDRLTDFHLSGRLCFHGWLSIIIGFNGPCTRLATALQKLFNGVLYEHAKAAQYRWGLSWEDAQEEAGKWLGQFHLGRDLEGKVIDLSRETLPFEGKFRSMVLEALRRKLKKRKAKEVMLPPDSD